MTKFSSYLIIYFNDYFRHRDEADGPDLSGPSAKDEQKRKEYNADDAVFEATMEIEDPHVFRSLVGGGDPMRTILAPSNFPVYIECDIAGCCLACRIIFQISKAGKLVQRVNLLHGRIWLANMQSC